MLKMRREKHVKGEIALGTGISWQLDENILHYGQNDDVDFRLNIEFRPLTDYLVNGSNLWRAAIYGSTNDKGIGDKYLLKEQILSSEQSSMDLLANVTMLDFGTQKLQYDYTEVSCSNSNFLCVEFFKGDSPEPDFELEINTESRRLVACKKLQCRNEIVLSNLRVDDTSVTDIDVGSVSSITLNDVKANHQVLGRGVSGTRLWQLMMWASSNENGDGKRAGAIMQILNENKQNIPLLPMDKELNFGDIQVDFDATNLQADQVKYLCLELSESEDAIPNFQVTASPDASSLITCRQTKREIVLLNIEWKVSTKALMIGEKDNITATYTAVMSPTSSAISGENMWKVGVFGSTNIKGTGERFNYIEQMLAQNDSSKSLSAGGSLKFVSDLKFDLSATGCGKWTHLCTVISKNPTSSVDFEFQTGILEMDCEKAGCYHDINVHFKSKATSEMLLDPGSSTNPLAFDTSLANQGLIGINGNNSWKVVAFGSDDADGNGVRYNEQQVLNTLQSNTRLEPISFETGVTLTNMGNVTFNFDMRDLSCDVIQYMCLQLLKGDDPEFQFNLHHKNAVFENDPLRGTICTPIACRTITLTGLDWDLDKSKAVIGQPSEHTLIADVATADTSDPIRGQHNWQMSIFGSENIEGTGARFGDVSQILNQNQSSKSYAGTGETMNFAGVEFDFESGSIGCDDFKFICVEIKKGRNPEPDFILLVENGGDSLITCEKSDCKNEVVIKDIEVEVLGQILSNEQDNSLQLRFRGLPADISAAVSGMGLWQISLFGSTEPDGSGLQYGTQETVLMPSQQDEVLNPDGILDFTDIIFNFDMSELSCAEVKYMCARLEMGENPNIDFTIRGIDNAGSLTQCVEIECQGV